MKLNGADPDFQRRDLFDAIATGNFPEFEFAIQAFEEKTAASELIREALNPPKSLGLVGKKT